MSADQDYPDWDETIGPWTVPTYSLTPGELVTRLGPDPPETDREKALLILVDEIRIFGSGTPYTLSQPTSNDPDAEYWVAGDDSSLRQALLDIVGGQLSCEIKLEGSITEEDARLGSVILNSEHLDYDDENGWQWVSPTMIRLTGSACDTLLSSESAMLNVSFPAM